MDWELWDMPKGQRWVCWSEIYGIAYGPALELLFLEHGHSLQEIARHMGSHHIR